jgi:ParB-like chromosome segregation protein Spo0J
VRASALQNVLWGSFMADLKTMNPQKIAIKNLKHDPDNARKHSQKNLDAIAGSLARFGQQKPIVVNGENIVLAGNGTLAAARELGWSEIVAVRVPVNWTWEQQRAYALADNRTAEMAEWDSEKLAAQLIELDSVGWELDDVGFEKLQPPTEELPATKRKPVVCPDCGAEFIPG